MIIHMIWKYHITRPFDASVVNEILSWILWGMAKWEGTNWLDRWIQFLLLIALNILLNNKSAEMLICSLNLLKRRKFFWFDLVLWRCQLHDTSICLRWILQESRVRLSKYPTPYPILILILSLSHLSLQWRNSDNVPEHFQTPLSSSNFIFF